MSKTHNKAIFFVASPLQALCAIEACEHYNLSKSDLCIVRINKARETENILKVSKLYSWGKIYFYKKLILKSKIIQKSLEVISAHLFFRKLDHYTHVFVGDFVFTTAAIIGRGKYTVLGDGNKLLYQRKNFEDSSKYFPISRSEFLNRLATNTIPERMKTYLTRIFGLTYRIEVDFFSQFVLTGRDTVHKYKWCSARTKEKKLTFDQQNVYFLGTYFSEDTWGKISSENYYLWSICKIKEHFIKKGLEMVYVPSRHECKNKLTKIRSDIGVKIIEFQNIVELEFLNRGVYPAFIASFYSTALINVPIIYPKCQAEAFLVDIDQFTPSWFGPCVTPIYEYYKKRMPINKGIIDQYYTKKS